MKFKNLTLLFPVIQFSPGNKPEFSPVFRAIEAQLQQYPKSTLKDIYKSFFQDEYGPGHLLKDMVAARRYFDYELSVMKSKAYYKDEPCGLGRNFYRAGMDCIVDGLVDSDVYFAAFMKSSAGFSLPDINEWREKWETIMNEILPLRSRMNSFDEDRAEISEMLKNGEYVIHHSEQYIKAYDPHYRIMRKPDFDSASML